MPLGDWQFWVVTLLGLGSLYLVIKPFLPGKSKSGSCPHCSSGAASRKKRGHRVAITVDRKHLP